jgi:hypothetical protein
MTFVESFPKTLGAKTSATGRLAIGGRSAVARRLPVPFTADTPRRRGTSELGKGSSNG